MKDNIKQKKYFPKKHEGNKNSYFLNIKKVHIPYYLKLKFENVF